jgi:hypothetical protein
MHNEETDIDGLITYILNYLVLLKSQIICLDKCQVNDIVTAYVDT